MKNLSSYFMMNDAILNLLQHRCKSSKNYLDRGVQSLGSLGCKRVLTKELQTTFQ